ncbi:MAG: PilZ domain-containing protein [Candidatus Omnitrophota bacterium]
MIERRKFIRLPAPIGISYKPLKKGRSGKPTVSFIRNIGGGGVRFVAKDELRPGDLLDIRIEIPNVTDPVRAVGEVVWYTESDDRRREAGEAGIKFREIDPKDLHRILEYVHAIGIG